MLLDDIDHRILEILQADARTPLAAVAKVVGLSGAAVAERVRKMETTRLIRGYTALVDSERLGKPLTAFIRVTRGPGGATAAGEQRPAEALVADPDVVEMHHVAGEDCYILKVRAANPRGLEVLLDRLRARMDVTRTVTMIVLSTLKEDGRVTESEEDAR